MEDENIAVLVEVNNRNLIEAKDKGCAVIIEPEGRVDFEFTYTVLSDHLISLDGIRIIFVLFDLDTYYSTQELDFDVSPRSEGSVVQSIDLKDYMGFGDVQFISGIYKLRIEVSYSLEGRAMTLEGEPFYVRITGNPMMTINGVIATAGFVYAGISIFSAARSVKNSVLFELDRSIQSTKVSPTEKLLSFYKGKSAKKAQSEVSKQVFGHVRSTWKREECPSCSSKWLEGLEKCPECGLPVKDAEILYSKDTGEKCLSACEELGISVSGYAVGEIAQKLGEGIPVTTNVISLLANSGLAIVEPKVGKRMKASTRRLLFTGLSASVVVLFWIQACGLGAPSLYMLVIAIITGIVLPLVISRLLGNRIRSAISTFWKSKLDANTTMQP